MLPVLLLCLQRTCVLLLLFWLFYSFFCCYQFFYKQRNVFSTLSWRRISHFLSVVLFPFPLSSPRFLFSPCLLSSPLVARCLPRCNNGGSCRHPNHCVCQKGFRGRRCEVSDNIQSTNHRPISIPPEPGAGTGPALSQAVTPAWTKTAASVLKPSSPRVEGHNKDSDIMVSVPTVKFGLFKTEQDLSKAFLMNDASPKSQQVRRTAEDSTPEVNHLQPQVGDTEEATEDTSLQSQQTLTESPDLESALWQMTEGHVIQYLLRPTASKPALVERLISPEIQVLESSWRSATDIDQRARSEVEDKFNPGPSAGPILEHKLNMDPNGGQKTVDVTVIGEKKKKVKSGAAKKQLLR